MIRAYIGWAIGRFGYWIRPYDMLADRRRWFWQPAQRCGGCWVCLPVDGEERK